MLAVEALIKALAEEDRTASFTDSNDDRDFGKVLDFYSSGETKTQGHTLRYSDGTERIFSFDS